MSDGPPKPAPPNLDLIQMVQAARLAHDAGVLPSQVHGVYWLEVKRETAEPVPTPRAGRWVVETTMAEADALWVLIRAATRDGRLGYKAKASTAARVGGTGRDQREIHVETVDRDDAADIERVRVALVALGVTGPLRYDRE